VRRAEPQQAFEFGVARPRHHDRQRRPVGRGDRVQDVGAAGELQHVLAATPQQQDLQVRNAVFLPCEVERGEAPAVVAHDVEGPAGDDDARSRGARRPIHPRDALEQAVSPVVELVAAEGRTVQDVAQALAQG